MKYYCSSHRLYNLYLGKVATNFTPVLSYREESAMKNIKEEPLESQCTAVVHTAIPSPCTKPEIQSQTLLSRSVQSILLRQWGFLKDLNKFIV